MSDGRQNPEEKPEGSKSLAGLALGALAVLLIVNYLALNNAKVGKTIAYSEFLSELDRGNVQSVVLSEFNLTGELKEAPAGGSPSFNTVIFEDDKLVSKLAAKGVKFRREVPSTFLSTILSTVLPIAFFYVIWMIFMRRASGAMQGGVFSMTRSRAKAYFERSIKTTFADVAGVDEAKAELAEIVSFLKEPARFSRLGGRTPKGILLVGPPGTGKTLLARALAGEASVPFFSINGSEFVEMFVGLGAARVRDLFVQTRKNAPCILFIDEIDALGRSRAAGLEGMGGQDEKEQTLNQLLAEIDGFDPSEGVIILAATNRPEILDQALLRAGRFDRQILVNLPDKMGRMEILKVHTKRIKVAVDLDLERIAALTPGFSGADLANLVNEAALVATRRGGDSVTEADFTQAVERLVAGIEQRKRLMNPDEKKRVAFHEMGHATVALSRRARDKVHKVSIIPRGMGALGYTLQRPTEDRYLMSQAELETKIAVLLGGRASEKVFLEQMSTGAADDLAKATDIARAMVVQHGMSEAVGLAAYEVDRARYLMAPGMRGMVSAVSEDTLRKIDSEIRRMLLTFFDDATRRVEANRQFVEAGVEYLLKNETLEEQQLLSIWQENGGVEPQLRVSHVLDSEI